MQKARRTAVWQRKGITEWTTGATSRHSAKAEQRATKIEVRPRKSSRAGFRATSATGSPVQTRQERAIQSRQRCRRANKTRDESERVQATAGTDNGEAGPERYERCTPGARAGTARPALPPESKEHLQP